MKKEDFGNYNVVRVVTKDNVSDVVKKALQQDEEIMELEEKFLEFITKKVKENPSLYKELWEENFDWWNEDSILESFKKYNIMKSSKKEPYFSVIISDDNGTVNIKFDNFDKALAFVSFMRGELNKKLKVGIYECTNVNDNDINSVLIYELKNNKL